MCALLALGCYVSNALHTAAFCAVSILLIHRVWRHGRAELARLPGLELPIALYATSFLLSSALGLAPAHSFPYVTELKRIVVAFLVASSLRDRRDLALLLGAILVGAVLTTGCAFHQYLFGGEYTRMRVTIVFQPYELQQAFGLASSVNDLAGLLILALGVSAGPLLFGSVPRRTRWLLGAAAIVIVLGLLRSMSRSGFVGAGVGLAATGFLVNPRRTLVVFLALLCLYPALPENLKTRHRQLFDTSLVPNRFRIRMVHLSMEMARDHLPWGIGRRNFEPLHRTMRQGTEEVSPNAHNNYLNLLVEQGILGLVTLVWLQLSMLLYLFRMVRAPDGTNEARTCAIGVFMSLASFTAAGLFDFYWGFSLPVTVMWILVGAVYAIGQGRIPELPTRLAPSRRVC